MVCISLPQIDVRHRSGRSLPEYCSAVGSLMEHLLGGQLDRRPDELPRAAFRSIGTLDIAPS